AGVGRTARERRRDPGRDPAGDRQGVQDRPRRDPRRGVVPGRPGARLPGLPGNRRRGPVPVPDPGGPGGGLPGDPHRRGRGGTGPPVRVRGGGVVMTPRVVITGIGLVTALGAGRRAVWDALLAGRSAVGRVRSFDTRGYRVGVGAELPDDAADE